MGHTMVEKILAAHATPKTKSVKPGDIVDVAIDARVARDFGGANVVKNLKDAGLGIHDAAKTCFTFDCNPGGSDPAYAANQQTCRQFARGWGLSVHDVNTGIGTHLAIDEGLVHPGGTLVSTDSHANILGAIGAFGQGMGDQDIAYVWAHGSIWFKVPPTVKVVFTGRPGPRATAKDLTLAAARVLGADGLLEHAAEFTGPVVDDLDLASRITMASMCTEMGGIIALFAPDEAIVDYCRERSKGSWKPVFADADAVYARTVEVDVDGLEPLASRPGKPEDVVEVATVKGKKIDSGFIGSCTNGRYEDLAAAARVLEGRKVAPGVVLKIVPATDEIWQRCLQDGLIEIFKEAGALVGNAGCAGCAAGQLGQNGPGEVTVSTGNRNFPGKQGKGDVWLASPATVAASALAGFLTTAAEIPEEPALFATGAAATAAPAAGKAKQPPGDRPTRFTGRAWAIDVNNVDTDMIYHNKHLTVTDVSQMGQYAFGNLKGREKFATQAQPGDVVLIGSNFGCGSSRQQAVDCFRALKTSVVVAKSFGSIYERNAINSGTPILVADWSSLGLKDGDQVTVDLEKGTVTNVKTGAVAAGRPAASVQLEIYRRGGLL